LNKVVIAGELVGSQVTTTRCWCVTRAIKVITLSALCPWWRQYQRMAGNARWANVT